MTLSSANRVGILVAVRMKSARLSNKAMGEIEGKPLILHLIERMKRVAKCDGIVLCTSIHPDDRILLDIADKAGILKFAGDEVDVMKRFIDAAEQYNFDTIVRVTGDNPLTDPENIDRLIETCLTGKFDFVKSEYLPLGVNAEVVTLATLKKAHAMAVDTSLTEYMTSYLKQPEIFKIHTLQSEDPFFKNRSKIRLTVDFKEDLEVMRSIYGHLYSADPAFTTREVLKYLDDNPTILDMNANMLEIPLPKIRFKGQKEYAKKLVAVIEDLDKDAAIISEAVHGAQEFELTGFIDHGNDFQYTLLDGVPIIGETSSLKSLSIDAQYFVTKLQDSEIRNEIAEDLTTCGLVEIELFEDN